MPRKWVYTPLPVQGSGGEQSDAAPGLLEPGRAKLLRNALIAGPGAIQQAPDWLKGDICKNLAGTPVEGHAVCGVFPFAQAGGASAPSAGIAFSFNGDDDKVYLHQLGEVVNILRTLQAFASFTNGLPPQITAFEMFGKLYFVPYRPDEAVSVRKGMGVFDPAGAGAVAFPTFVLGAGPAAVLKFRGISKHRGATILGWGYLSESDADEAHVLRYCKYGAPDTWVPDTTDTTAGFLNVGTLKVPIVGCAMSGQYTIIGKETEVFALDGDFSAQFYYRQIGGANGPVSTVGIVAIDEAAVWMALKGPAISQNGQPVELLAIDRVMRRFLSYMDLTTAWAVHDPDRQRVIWGVRRKSDDDSALVTNPYLTELFWWDYVHRAFGTHSLPTPIFSLGLIRGPGTSLAGPTGVVSAINASLISFSGARIGWTPGDTSPDVTFRVQHRLNGTSTWLEGGTTAPAQTYRDLTGLAAGRLYDVQVAQLRNGQQSAFVQAVALFTTLTAAATPDPAAAAVLEPGICQCSGTNVFERARATWTPFTAPGTVVVCYHSLTSNFGDAANTGVAVPGAGQVDTAAYQVRYPNEVHYFWLRTEAVDGSGGLGNAVQCTPFGLTLVDTGHCDCSRGGPDQ